ncbi:MAG: peptidyl-prolyl cis-trans isomerase [Kiritimatiellae bacterium]|nr:peptidyl-prolyl cis-trans isomerase [Kiritimatiellia bacterium]
MNICQTVVSVLTLVAMVGNVSCSRERQPTENQDVLVRMGGEVITLNDLESEIARIRVTGRPVGSHKEVLERLVAFKAQVLRARALKLDQSPEVARELEKVLVNALRQHELAQSEAEIAEEELRKLYAAEIAQYTQPAADRLAILFLRIEKNASSEKRAEVHQRMAEAQAEALKQPLHSGRGPSMQGFAQLSMTHSDDGISRYRGGDIGWSNRGTPSARLPEEIWQAGIALKQGEISAILESSDGLYLLKKTDFRPEIITPFEAVRAAISKKILAQNRQKREQEFIARCLALVSPQINAKGLMRLTESAGAVPEGASPAVSALGVPHE